MEEKKSLDGLTDVRFSEILFDILSTEPLGSLLMIPGIYEILSEHFNNVVIDIYLEEPDVEQEEEREELTGIDFYKNLLQTTNIWKNRR